jgi:hypothetical protein
MVTVGLLVRLIAKPGKEAKVTSFLEEGLATVEDEPATIAWFAIRLGPSEFSIFDAFPDDAGRGPPWRPGGRRADGPSASVVGAATGDRAGRRHRGQAAWVAPPARSLPRPSRCGRRPAHRLLDARAPRCRRLAPQPGQKTLPPCSSTQYLRWLTLYWSWVRMSAACLGDVLGGGALGQPLAHIHEQRHRVPLCGCSNTLRGQRCGRTPGTDATDHQAS